MTFTKLKRSAGKMKAALAGSSLKPLTEGELELMTIIWQLGECTVKDVQSSLPSGRNLAYTSVATLMKILEQKKILISQKGEKAHIYRSLITKSLYESSTLQHVAQSLFENKPSSMVLRLLDEAPLSTEELHLIRKFVNERLES